MDLPTNGGLNANLHSSLSQRTLQRTLPRSRLENPALSPSEHGKELDDVIKKSLLSLELLHADHKSNSNAQGWLSQETSQAGLNSLPFSKADCFGVEDFVAEWLYQKNGSRTREEAREMSAHFHTQGRSLYTLSKNYFLDMFPEDGEAMCNHVLRRPCAGTESEARAKPDHSLITGKA